MAKTTQIIYPKEAHPATRILSLVGTLFAVSLLGLLVAFGIAQTINPGKYLASVGETVTGGDAIMTATSSEQLATSTPEATARFDDGPTSQNSPLAAALTPGEKKTTIYPTTAEGFLSLPSGIPDLAIAIVDTGIINGVGNFIPATSTGSGEQTGLVFEVSNSGTAASGQWRFVAHLPTLSGDFTSELQDSLNPGEKIRYTIGFQLLRNQGQNTVSIDIDPTRQITTEANRNNNTASVIIIRNY